MNFYIDFEATQFSQEIISIGCVAENGNTFNCLVRPHDIKKVTPFITNLTGISHEMLEEHGLSAEDAFYQFYLFVQQNNGNAVPVYYCYGNQDKDFIKNTIKHMNNFNTIIFASSVRDMMIDYSTEVKSYLAVTGLALKKLVALIRHVDEVEQNHDALSDAMMLKECCEGLTTLNKPSPIEKPVVAKRGNAEFEKAYQKLINEQGSLKSLKLPGHMFTVAEKMYLKKLRCEDWDGLNATLIVGDATEENYKVKLTHIRSGNVKYFSEVWVAAMFLNGYVFQGRSPKAEKALNAAIKAMGLSPNNYGGYRCEIKMEEN